MHEDHQHLYMLYGVVNNNNILLAVTTFSSLLVLVFYCVNNILHEGQHLYVLPGVDP